MASTSTLDHDDKAFGFFGLTREIRDSIYGQPEMLERLPLREPPAKKYAPDKQLDCVKLRESPLLVSREFNTEYREICESQIGIHHASNMNGTNVPLIQPTVLLQRATEEAHVLHLHIGGWFLHLFCDDGFGLRDLLVDWSSRMPKLQAITLVAYMGDHIVPKENAEAIRDATARLFAAVESFHGSQSCSWTTPSSGRSAIIREKSFSCSGLRIILRHPHPTTHRSTIREKSC
jgi:hypothetical protein